MKTDNPYYEEPDNNKSFWIIVVVVGIKILVLSYFLLEVIGNYL